MLSSVKNNRSSTLKDQGQKARLSVIIVTYNSEDFIAECLKRLFSQLRTINSEIFVIDNQSTDRTISLLATFSEKIRLIKNDENVGFAAACNLGAAKSSGDYILFLNPDTFCTSDVVLRTLVYMKIHTGTAVAACALRNRDLTLQSSYRNYPTLPVLVAIIIGFFMRRRDLPLLRRYYCLDESAVETKSVPWVTGAFMMLSRKAFESVGGFDENYFLYCEDADLCYRLRRLGFNIDYVPEAGYALHHHQQSSYNPFRKYAFIHLKSFLRFILKHQTRIFSRQASANI